MNLYVGVTDNDRKSKVGARLGPGMNFDLGVRSWILSVFYHPQQTGVRREVRVKKTHFHLSRIPETSK